MPVATLTPVVERIAEIIADRLETLLVVGTEQTLVVEVVRPTRLGTWTPQDNQIVLAVGPTVEVPELSYPGNPPATCHETTYNVKCHVMPSENDETNKAFYIHRFAADVRKVICTPAATWHNFDELAIDAMFGQYTPIDSDGSFDGIDIPLMVRYRTDEGNPYEPRA